MFVQLIPGARRDVYKRQRLNTKCEPYERSTSSGSLPLVFCQFCGSAWRVGLFVVCGCIGFGWCVVGDFSCICLPSKKERADDRERERAASKILISCDFLSGRRAHTNTFARRHPTTQTISHNGQCTQQCIILTLGAHNNKVQCLCVRRAYMAHSIAGPPILPVRVNERAALLIDAQCKLSQLNCYTRL